MKMYEYGKGKTFEKSGKKAMKTEDLLQDLSRFVPAWKNDWTPAPGMLDFEEKWESFHNPKGRLMVCAHRGDINIYYPENSLEGCLAAIEAGADMLEIDLHTTADGQIVIMHDDTLTRTTNLTALRQAGEKWMPESDEIRDWTLEQIRRLRLVTKSGELTEYAVPTLREILSIAKNRVFVTLDKTDSFRWEDAYAVVQELRAYRTVLIPYNYPLERVLKIQNHVRRTTGYNMPFFAGMNINAEPGNTRRLYETAQFLKTHHMPPILRGTYHNIAEEQQVRPLAEQFTQTHRIYSESMGIHRDFPETWQSMLKMGFNTFMGNRLYDFLKLVKERHFSNTL